VLCPCDDETQSGHNSEFVWRHASANFPVDFPGRAFYDAFRGISGAASSPIGAAREDVTIPSRVFHFLFLTRGTKIGWSAAPKQFCRLPVLFVVLSRRLLAFPSGFYIGDLQVVETLVSRGLSTGLLGLGDFPGVGAFDIGRALGVSNRIFR
jgi:hypothetical protein